MSGSKFWGCPALYVLLSIGVCIPAGPLAEAGTGQVDRDPVAREAELLRLTSEYRDAWIRLTRLESSPRIIVDTSGCTLRFRSRGEDSIVAQCSAGSGRSLTDQVTGSEWTFQTPHGEFRVESKLRKPVWRKPDWAFVEEGKRPPENAGDRFEAGVLGDYALGFGDGYFIHGTLYTRLIGQNVTHGCVRLDDAPLEALYRAVPIGTPLLIF